MKPRYKKHPIYGEVCCHCGCPISYRPRPPEKAVPVCSCDYQPFRVGIFAKPSKCRIKRQCGICRRHNCSGCKGSFLYHHKFDNFETPFYGYTSEELEQKQNPCKENKYPHHHGHHHNHHHILNPKRVPLPTPVFNAMTIIVYEQGWKHRDLFVELTAPILNPTLVLDENIVLLYNWANQKGKEDERFDLILRAFDNGFYQEYTPEQQLFELFQRYNKLEEPYRTNAFNVAREVLAIFHIEAPII